MGNLGNKTEINNLKKEKLLEAAAREKTSIKDGERLDPTKAESDKLYTGDLESTINHIILKEIPSVEIITGEFI